MIHEYTPSDTEAAALSLLRSTQAEGWITGAHLAVCLWHRDTDRNRRNIRAIVKALREAGYMIFSEQGRGYSMCLDYGNEAARAMIDRGQALTALGRHMLGEIAEARRRQVLIDLWPAGKIAQTSS